MKIRDVINFIKIKIAPDVTDNGHEHFINLNGVNDLIFCSEGRGEKITVAGWNNDHWNYKVGHRVIISRNGMQARYKIDKVRHCGDPVDQYFIDCIFHPRKKLKKGAK